MPDFSLAYVVTRASRDENSCRIILLPGMLYRQYHLR